MTVTTVDDELAAKIEPGAPCPTRRLKALEGLSRAGIFAGVVLMPVLPFLEDSGESVLAVVEAAADAGARFVYPAFGMTLRDRQREYYYRQLVQRFPGMRERYEKQFGDRYWCTSPRAGKLWEVFARRCEERGLLYKMGHIISAAKRPYGDTQLTFFDM